MTGTDQDKHSRADAPTPRIAARCRRQREIVRDSAFFVTKLRHRLTRQCLAFAVPALARQIISLGSRA